MVYSDIIYIETNNKQQRKNEVMIMETLKVNETQNEVLASLNKKAMAKVNAYHKAVAAAEKSAWSLAEVVHGTVNSADFKKQFGSIERYAIAIGKAKGYVSELNKAVNTRVHLVNINPDAAKLSYGVVQEIGRVEVKQLPDFMAMAYDLKTHISSKDTREIVKEWNEEHSTKKSRRTPKDEQAKSKKELIAQEKIVKDMSPAVKKKIVEEVLSEELGDRFVSIANLTQDEVTKIGKLLTDAFGKEWVAEHASVRSK